MDDFLSSAPQTDNPLIEACYEGNIDTVTKLLDYDSTGINEKGNAGATALHIAAQNGSLDLVTILLYRGADVNTLSIDGWTPLHFAAQRGYVDVSAALIKAGVNINLPGLRYHRTALHYASDQGKSEVVALLLKSGADRSLKDKDGHTALDIATKKEHLETINILAK